MVRPDYHLEHMFDEMVDRWPYPLFHRWLIAGLDDLVMFLDYSDIVRVCSRASVLEIRSRCNALQAVIPPPT